MKQSMGGYFVCKKHFACTITIQRESPPEEYSDKELK